MQKVIKVDNKVTIFLENGAIIEKETTLRILTAV